MKQLQCSEYKTSEYWIAKKTKDLHKVFLFASKKCRCAVETSIVWGRLTLNVNFLLFPHSVRSISSFCLWNFSYFLTSFSQVVEHNRGTCDVKSAVLSRLIRRHIRKVLLPRQNGFLRFKKQKDGDADSNTHPERYRFIGLSVFFVQNH